MNVPFLLILLTQVMGRKCMHAKIHGCKLYISKSGLNCISKVCQSNYENFALLIESRRGFNCTFFHYAMQSRVQMHIQLHTLLTINQILLLM